MSSKKTSIIITLILITGYASFASALINPGDTLNPVVTNPTECPNGPTDPTCIVTLPLGGSITANNGLTATGSNVGLGGVLLNDTTITTDGKEFTIQGPNSKLVSGADPLGFAPVFGDAFPGMAMSTDGTQTGGLQSWVGTLVEPNNKALAVVGNFDLVNGIQAAMVAEDQEVNIYSSDGVSGFSNIILNSGSLSLSTSDNLYLYAANFINFNSFPSSRDDSGTNFPANFLYTDGSGNLRSAPLSLLGGGGGGSLKWYAENTAAPTAAPIATGTGSIALGDGAQALSNNMFVYGNEAGVGITAPNVNSIGQYSGFNAINAEYANFFGFRAGYGATDAYEVNFIGNSAGVNATNAYYSNFIGSNAGYGATNANSSNFIGISAGYGATDANNSNFFGDSAGVDATGASSSNFLGSYAGYNATYASHSNFLGLIAGRNATNAYQSNFIGNSAGESAANAHNSNFIGPSAGETALYANDSNFIGSYAGYSAQNASYSNFLGQQAGADAINASSSNFIGPAAGFNAQNAANSNFIGNSAGYEATNSSDSNFIGIYAGYRAFSANQSNFLGFWAGYEAEMATQSNFLGTFAGFNAQNAANSNFIGKEAGFSSSNASNSIFIGTLAGNNDTVNNTTNPNDFSILIGKSTSTGGFSNSIAIGGSATNTASNQFMIGSTTRSIDQTKIIGSLGTECTITTGTGMACTSDERLKTNITDLTSDTLSKLQNVRTVSYNWLQNPNSPTQIGFLAQNLEQYFPEMVMTDATGKKQVYYSQMTPILVEAIRELNLKVDTLQLANGSTSTDIFSSLKNWLGDVENGVTDFFAQRGHFKELCIGEPGNETCLTKSQVDSIIGNVPNSISSPVINSSESDSDINDTTPEETVTQTDTTLSREDSINDTVVIENTDIQPDSDSDLNIDSTENSSPNSL